MTDAPTREERDGARKDKVAASNATILPAPSSSTEQKSLLSGRTDDAVAFLEAWCPSGPWVLTSIVPDGGKTTTATFTGREVEALHRWIDIRQGRQNLYFTVNRTFNTVEKKPSKADMAAAVALHVDIDPRAGEELESERARALKLLQEFKPAPTVIIDSGGGYQGFWVLDAPCDLAGNPEDERRHLPVEERNLAIEVTLQADRCHNIDRIMRLPGTINVPGEKKRAKGRQPALAHVVAADWQRRYRLEDFPRESRTPVSTSSVATPHVAAPADVDIATLPVSDALRALIVNGRDPDNPQRWPSKSEALHHAICAMIREDLPDTVILGVILDRDLGISEHVLKDPKPHKYAMRQLARALAVQPRPGPIVFPVPLNLARAYRDARRPHLRHHQQEFLDWDGAAYVNVSDETVRAELWMFLETCRVKTEKDGPKTYVPTSASVSATADALKAVTHLPPPEPGGSAIRWLDGRSGPNPLDLLPTRSGLLHLPSGELLPATPDLFTRNALDFAHDPNASKPVRWLNFLREVWPDHDEADCIVALQQFMGYLLTPDTRLQKALMLDGPRRSGKGTIGRVMRRLVGEANTTAPSMNSLGGTNFGLEPLLAKQLAIISDMRLSNKTDEAALAENLLRITGEDPVSVNRKNKLALEMTLGVRFVVMTNEVPKFADRSGALVGRFIVLPMRQSFYGREDSELTDRLMAELPGILNWAVEGWRCVRANARITQPESGHDVAEQMVDLASPFPAFVSECCKLGPGEHVPKADLIQAFRIWFRDSTGQEYRSPPSVFARDLYSATDKAVRSAKPRGEGGRAPHFSGISLLPGAVRDLERASSVMPW
jgi:P4 family phage/plasmid primase-like protien